MGPMVVPTKLEDDHEDQQSDDFFGDDDDSDNNAGLGESEDRAMGARHQNIGYVDAFDASKEEHLQNGFEDGYKQSFDMALSLGKLLGKKIAQAQVVVQKDEKQKVITAALKATSQVRTLLQTFQNESSKDGTEWSEIQNQFESCEEILNKGA